MWFAIGVAIFLIVYPYCGYPLFLKVLPKSKKYYEKDDGAFFVSLYIAAYNEEKVIAQKLENSLHLLTKGIPFEIVVGSDGSTDRTNEIIQQYMKQYDNIRLLNFSDRQGKVNVLNRGIPLCKGNIIILSDANAMYNTGCIMSIVPHFRDLRVGCVAGEKRVLQENRMISSNEGAYWKLESKIKRMESQIETVIGADGACYAIRKNLFVKLPKETSVDDFLLSMKIVEQGYCIVYEPNAYSMEETGRTLQDEIKRKVRIAAGNYYNLKFLKYFLKFNLVSFMFYSHKLLRWISPFIFILLTGMLMRQSLYSDIAKCMTGVLLCSYIVAVLRYGGIKNRLINNKIGNVFTYFYVTVWAQLLGFLVYARNRQKAIWDTVRSE